VQAIEVRQQLIEALRLDLVGPDRNLGTPNEVLPQAPSRWYLTGFLVPIDAEDTQKADEAGTEELDAVNDAKGLDDAAIPEPAAARRARVGRDHERPGLVVTILNVHKPRDRSHYERFAYYHQTFYRSVEATSATPFSPRALDRGLAGTLVALARLGHGRLTPPLGAQEILNERTTMDDVIDSLTQRAYACGANDPTEREAVRDRVRARVKELLDDWSRIAMDYGHVNTSLQYNQYETGGAKPLLHHFLDPDLKTLPKRHRKFRANRSLRDVEPSVNLLLKTMDGIELESPEEEPP
jgi:hypothetical protein